MPVPWVLQLSGAVCCSAVVLVLAGAAKIWRGNPDSAIRRVLRIGPVRWRLTERAAGALECATGTAVCLGAAPRVAGSVMAALGTLFAGLLVRARRSRAPGGCGCLPWRAGEAITWRAIARAGCVLAAGVADVTAAPAGLRQAGHAWFVAGALTAALAYALLSMQLPARTPRCHRSLWFPVRDALRALTGNAVFGAFLDSHGPFAGVPGHRRDGCSDQFSFAGAAESGLPPQELLFEVSRGPGGTVAVHAIVHNRSHPTSVEPSELQATH